MGNLGVSVFTGMGQSLAENSAYLGLAAQFGYNRLFTSLHIPEADPVAFLREGKELLKLAARLKFSVTADISPRTLAAHGTTAGRIKRIWDFCVARRLGIFA